MEPTHLQAELARRMAERGLSARRLSHLAGLNETAIKAILNRRSLNPRADTLMKIAAALECTVADLTGEGQPPAAAPPAAIPVRSTVQEVDTTRVVDLPDRTAMPLDVPVYGVAVGGSSADFQMNGDVVDYVRRPPGLMHSKRAFAIYVVGSSMEPRYEDGDLVYLNPDRPPRPGDDVVVQMRPNGHGAGDCYIKRLVRRTPSQWVCRQFNPAGEVTYQADEVDRVFKVMTSAELMGV